MNTLVKPHGSEFLKPLFLENPFLNEERKRASNMLSLPVSHREKGDLLMLGIGGFTPLSGFMGHDDWKGVCDKYQLSNGLFWPIPITLSITETLAKSINLGTEIALIDPDNQDILATMQITVKYRID